MSNFGKYSLVKTTAKIDLDTDSGYVEFLKIAKESGLTKERCGTT